MLTSKTPAYKITSLGVTVTRIVACLLILFLLCMLLFPFMISGLMPFLLIDGQKINAEVISVDGNINTTGPGQ